MAEPERHAPAASADQVLEVLGETVIIRRDPAGRLVDAIRAIAGEFGLEILGAPPD